VPKTRNQFAVNRQGILFLWPVRLPTEDGRLDAWDQAALSVTLSRLISPVEIKL
jgi:hypothetical protein